MYKPILALIFAAVPNCPLVNVAGNYKLDLRTESASSWDLSDKERGCRKSGGTTIEIDSNGLMTGNNLTWPPGNSSILNNSGKLGGRVEPEPEPMQWVASAGDVEMKGTWKRGQLSGEFVRRFIYDGKEIECRGKVSGFKRGK